MLEIGKADKCKSCANERRGVCLVSYKNPVIKKIAVMKGRGGKRKRWIEECNLYEKFIP